MILRVAFAVVRPIAGVFQRTLSSRIGKVLLALAGIELALAHYVSQRAALIFDMLVFFGVPLLIVGYVSYRGYRFIVGRNPTSGREQYNTSWKSWVRGKIEDEDIPVDRVDKRDPDGPATPSVDDDTSTIVLGQTGTGKSTFVKSRLQSWDFDGAVIAHALSDPGGRNEFVEFFEARGQDVQVLSSRNSDLRWDPFLDLDESIRDMETLATGIFETREVVETGWSEPARAMLVSALTVTSARHDDFARLTDVLEQGPEFIAEEIQKVPDSGLVAAPITSLDESERQTVYTTLLNQIRPLLRSDIFDSSVERISLRGYLSDPSQRVLVLDNIREDRYARGFWRFFLQSSIDLGFSTEGRQQFLLDEFDKLPDIDNLDELASAGRSAGLVGMLVAQDVHQVEDIYGSMARSIWTNCPNRVMFRAGDIDTAEIALSSIGKVEMRTQSVSDERGAGHEDQRLSTGIEERCPLVSGDLTDLDVGEALVQSPDGWWLCKLTELDLTPSQEVTDP